MSNQTHVTVLLDRSGSMNPVRADVVGGVNAFVAQQREASDRATLTLVQFDSQDPYEVLHSAMPLDVVPVLTLDRYVPRSSTPLYDAIGRCFGDLDNLLQNTPAAWRPANIVVAIVTDGKENSSREFCRRDVRLLIDSKKKQGWEIVYLSSDLGALRDVRELGIDYESSLLFDHSKQGVADAFDSMGKSVLRKRGGGKAGFTDDDRKTVGGEK